MVEVYFNLFTSKLTKSILTPSVVALSVNNVLTVNLNMSAVAGRRY